MQNRNTLIMKIIPLFLIPLLVTTAFVPRGSAATDEIDWKTHDEGLQLADQKGQYVFIDFWASWCGPCQDMEENVYTQDKVKELTDDIVFVKVNTEEQTQLARQYGVSSIPTLVFLDQDGEEVRREVGGMTADQLVSLIQDVISSDDDSNTASNDSTDTSEEDISEDESLCCAGEDSAISSNLLLIEIIVSLAVAGAVIFFIRKNNEPNEEE